MNFVGIIYAEIEKHERIKITVKCGEILLLNFIELNSECIFK